MSRFELRGIVEGYYGPPFSHEDRCWWIDRLGAWGMNLYVYAPKSDRLQRDQWHEPYPAETLAQFAELVERGERVGVRVGFSVSPGLSIRYSSRDDLASLRSKLLGFRDLGVRFFSLGLDDVPSRMQHEEDRRAFASLAEAHVSLAHAVGEWVGPECGLWLVPTDYLGTEPTGYLETLGAELDPAIEVGWTGRTVVSPTLPVQEAARRAATLRRRLLVWDNVPVSDGPMRPLLHLGPYVGRDPDLAQHVSGILLNPMQHARASGVAVRTAADYLRDPAGYDPERSWGEALRELGAGAERGFADFASAHRFSALLPDQRDPELEAALAGLRRAAQRAGGLRGEVERLAALLGVRGRAAGAVREGLEDRVLLRELEPWLAAHEGETQRMQAAIECLQALTGDTPRMHGVAAFFGLQSRLEGLELPRVASYGPRRVLYPQLGSMHEEETRFCSDPALFVDRCLSDEVVRFVEDQAAARLGVVRPEPLDPTRSRS